MECHFKPSKKKYWIRLDRNLEASYITLLKPDLNEVKDFWKTNGVTESNK